MQGMERGDRLKRAIAFYLAVALFVTLLPIVLSYSLGYHVDVRLLRAYKTGIISLKSSPPGAVVYCNGIRHDLLTPSRIEELKPGTYRIDVQKSGFYPWQRDLIVRPNMVTKAEEIVLFPLAQGIKKVSELEVINSIGTGTNQVYLFTRGGLYRANPDGSNVQLLSPYTQWPDDIRATSLSPDGAKLCYYTDTKIWVIDLEPAEQFSKSTGSRARVEEVVTSPDTIRGVFWYSASTHIVLVTDRTISVVELSGGKARNTVTLYTFNRPSHSFWYDGAGDTLYFTDVEADRSDGKEQRYLYRIELRQKFLDQLMHRIMKEFDIRYEKK